MQQADASVVKETAEAARLLAVAFHMLEAMGPEANGARKKLRTLELQFSHHVASSGAELQSAVQHMRRAEEQLGALSRAFQEGMEELRDNKAALEIVHAAQQTVAKFGSVLGQLGAPGAAAKQLLVAAAAADARGDAAALQQLLLLAEDETQKVQDVEEACHGYLADLTLRAQALESTAAAAKSEKLKARIAAAAQTLRGRRQQLEASLAQKAAAAREAAAAARGDLAQLIAQRLDQLQSAASDAEAWGRQAAQQQAALSSKMKSYEEQVAAAQAAAEQFKKRLLEDIEEAQNKVTSGHVEWAALEAQYSLSSRQGAFHRLLQQTKQQQQKQQKQRSGPPGASKWQQLSPATPATRSSKQQT
ncbi:myosin heavy chain, putative [Eimeria necatrix]|uniref:Myosin heavy chain, putative n=1 Tax=Eimeria necatrix TaxID=51315 RepID=U6MDA6_9EIME|nr:myosin heavy chain, putative [Eimeria necatrix]CDJ62212.1 myosin heavy chain, putative [Eimeria necatrix]